MATINAAGSTNFVPRMVMSKSRTMLRYADRDTSGAFVGVAQFVSRTQLSEVKITTPFTVV
jgi:hypothetical protein